MTDIRVTTTGGNRVNVTTTGGSSANVTLNTSSLNVSSTVRTTRVSLSQRGSQGAKGDQGSYYVKLFLRSATEPSSPTDVTWTPGSGRGSLSGANASGWSLTVPSGTNQLWEVENLFDPSIATELTAWSSVFQGGAEGPAGAVGAQGAQGDIGPQGAQGDIGPQGIIGPQGAQGDQGDIGPQGNTGAQGAQGETGAQGAQGAQGDVGPQGAQGFEGSYYVKLFLRASAEPSTPTDVTWTPGGNLGTLSGANSAGWSLSVPSGTDQLWEVQNVFNPGSETNLTSWSAVFQAGSEGPTGPRGAQGDQGAQGETGAQGAQGDQGDIGPQGAQGDQGDIGPQGVTGSQGAQGAQGETGAQGAQGDAGPQGSDGSSEVLVQEYNVTSTDNNDLTVDIGETINNNPLVYLNGYLQDKDNYSISGQVITFTTGNEVYTGDELVFVSGAGADAGANFSTLFGLTESSAGALQAIRRNAADNAWEYYDSDEGPSTLVRDYITVALRNAATVEWNKGDIARVSAENQADASGTPISVTNVTARVDTANTATIITVPSASGVADRIVPNGLIRDDSASPATLHYIADLSVVASVGTSISLTFRTDIGSGNLNFTGTTRNLSFFPVTLGISTERGGYMFVGTNGDSDGTTDADWAKIANENPYFSVNANHGIANASGQDSIAIGENSTSGGINSIAIGHRASSSGAEGVSLGYEATAFLTGLAIGADTIAVQNTVAIGRGVRTSGATSSVVIGQSAQAGRPGSIVIGAQARSSVNRGIAIGQSADASTDDAMAVGYDSEASGQRSTALGNSTHANHVNSVAIGHGSTTACDNQATFDGGNLDLITVPLGTADPSPTGLPDGSIYYNSTNDVLRVRVDGSWVDGVTASGAGASGGTPSITTLETTVINGGNYNTTTRVLTVLGIATPSEAFAVYQEGLRLAPSTYTVGTNSLTFGSGLTINNGDHIFVDLLA